MSRKPETHQVTRLLEEVARGEEGAADEDTWIVEPETSPLQLAGGEKGTFLFETRGVHCNRSGRLGYTIRILPHHPDLVCPFLPGLVIWAEP